MKTLLTTILILSSLAGFGQSGTYLYERIPTGHHVTTDSVIVLNKGFADCSHDWVTQKPMFNSGIVTAVYTNPTADRQSENYTICKKCLRHERTIYYHKWMLNKDEYQELLNKIKP